MGGQPSLPELDPEKVSLSERGKHLRELQVHIPENHPLETLDLANNELEALPPNIRNLRIVNISQNRFNFIPKMVEKALISYSSLTELYLSNNNIKTIPQSFSHLVELHTLAIDSNSIAEFNVEFPKLTHLNLMCNKITSFRNPPKYLVYLNLNFNFLSSLDFSSETITSLLLSGNNITTISDTASFPSCIVLNLSHNRISNIPPLAPIFPNLAQLGLSYNYMHFLPTQIPSRITALAFSNNYITSLGEEISDLQCLTTLIANNNYITAIPKLPSLIETLRIDNNRIAESEEIEMQNLKNLQLNNNDFDSIPDFSSSPATIFSISNNARLKEIKVKSLPTCITSCDLTKCSLDKINPEIFKLKQLKNLVLTGNNIHEVPAEIGKSFLLSLVVSENPIESLPHLPPTIMRFYGCKCKFTTFPEALMRLPKLSIIDVSCNSLTKLPTLPKAQFLNASCNKIEKFPFLPESIKYADFSHNMIKSCKLQGQHKHLLELDISHNNITSLDTDSVERATALQALKMSHNTDLSVDIILDNYPSLVALDILHTKVNIIIEESTDDLPIREIITDDGNKENSKYKQFCDLLSDGSEDVGYAEMKGNREQMEDALIIRKSIIKNDSIDAFAVLDGHAGYSAATFCANMLPVLLQSIEHFDCESVANEIQKLNALLEKKMSKDGTTMTLVMRNKEKHSLTCFNIGDSRALVVRKDGSVFPLTYDHKPDERSEMEKIRDLGGFVVEGRTSGVLAMSRSLGDFSVRGVTQVPSVVNYSTEGDDFRVVIACDGVFDVISNEDVGRIVSSEESISRAAYTLRNIAFTRMSQDNISVIVVSI